MGDPRLPAPSPVERLLERLRPQRARTLSRRERRVELASALLFFLAVAAIALGFESPQAPPLLDVVLLVVFAGVLAHIRLYIGGGIGVPTQLALIPMLFVLPPALVPVAMVAALVSARLVDVARGRAGRDRVICAVGDTWHAVGPALVFAIAAAPDATVDSWLVLIPAWIAQALFDTSGGILREWLGRGIPPGLQLRVMAWVNGLDVLLIPVAFAAVIAPVGGHRGWLMLAPLAGLLAALVADRRMRIEEEAARADELRRERTRLHTVLRRVGRALSANLDGEAMLNAVRETAREALGASAAFAGIPRMRATSSAADDVLVQAANLAASGSGTALVNTGAWHALACRLGRNDGGEVLAVARRAQPFSSAEVEILHHLAAHAAVSLENARLHARVREQATMDELTGLANHRALQHTLSEQLAGGERFAPRLSLVMLDIDDFKHVNDTWGHLAGDQVLRAVAEAIRTRCRSVDHPARYGGEELAVALPRTDAEGAQRIAEDLRSAVEALLVEIPDGPPIQVTVSAGVATSPEDGTTPSELVAAADAALYEAKRAGKNRVVAAHAALRAA